MVFGSVLSLDFPMRDVEHPAKNEAVKQHPPVKNIRLCIVISLSRELFLPRQLRQY